MSWKHYATEALDKLEEIVFKPAKQPNTHCCLSISDHESKLVCAKKKTNGFDLLAVDSIRYDNFDDFEYAIPSLFSKYDLIGIPTTLLLHPKNYQIFLIDSVPQNEDELTAALQWRVKNLINFPISEAVIDYFSLPPSREHKQQPLISAITARKTELLSITNLLKKHGINIREIDIPEIAIKNFIAKDEDNDKSHGILFIYDNIAVINITHKKSLYFSRQIEVNLYHKDTAYDLDQLSLEILRFFDYFQTQWRLPSPHTLLVGSNHDYDEILINQLANRLTIPIQKVQTRAHMFNNQDEFKLNDTFIPEISCIIYKDESDADSKN